MVNRAIPKSKADKKKKNEKKNEKVKVNRNIGIVPQNHFVVLPQWG